jgi:hypothetical protein
MTYVTMQFRRRRQKGRKEINRRTESVAKEDKENCSECQET